jgi:hypothetical protein
MLHLSPWWQEGPSAPETHDTWCRTAYANMRNGRAQAYVPLALRYVRDKVCVHAHVCAWMRVPLRARMYVCVRRVCVARALK